MPNDLAGRECCLAPPKLDGNRKYIEFWLRKIVNTKIALKFAQHQMQLRKSKEYSFSVDLFGQDFDTSDGSYYVSCLWLTCGHPVQNYKSSCKLRRLRFPKSSQMLRQTLNPRANAIVDFADEDRREVSHQFMPIVSHRYIKVSKDANLLTQRIRVIHTLS